MTWHYYPYMRTENGRWSVGPLFKDELQAGQWLLDRLMRHISDDHRVRSDRSQWLVDLANMLAQFLRREKKYIICPLCMTVGNIGALNVREGEKFVVAHRAGDDLVVQAGDVSKGLSFQTAMREMIRAFEEHVRTHGTAREKNYSEEFSLYTSFRCSQCAFEVRVVPITEIETP